MVIYMRYPVNPVAAPGLRAISTFFALFLFFVILSSNAQAQILDRPGQSSPFQSKARGFLQLSLGLSYMPLLDFEVEHPSPDIPELSAKNAYTRIPGMAAGLGIIPCFGHNGILIEGIYHLYGVQFETEGKFDALEISGSSTYGESMVDFHVGYIRYFLDGPYHLNLSGWGGMLFENVSADIGYDGEENVTSSDQFINYNFGAGFGFFKEMLTGGIGLDFRATFPILPAEYKLEDPWGKADYTALHPVAISLMVTFLMGQL